MKKSSIQKPICIIDTSIFDLYLKVHGQGTKCEFDAVDTLFLEKAKFEKMFLPMATILETGNHIAQIKDSVGKNKKTAATFFTELVKSALAGKAPFTLVDFLEAKVLNTWIDEFPSNALHKIGLADLSIIKDFDKLKAENKATRVYIWSKDGHLSAYDTQSPTQK